MTGKFYPLFFLLCLLCNGAVLFAQQSLMENCDTNGVCTPAPLPGKRITSNNKYNNMKVYYVGDPMCSWCWGIAEHLGSFEDYLSNKGINYEIVVGGLRPGGGDEWNDKFKDFLRHHWEEVNKRSGQPFGYDLLKLEAFNYDTEPSCRAVVTAKQFVSGKELSNFFKAVQRKFYVDSQDPKELEFYRSITDSFGIDYNKFIEAFQSDEIKEKTRAEFVLNRNWGVRGYPTLILEHEEKLYAIATGYATTEQMQETVEHFLKEKEAVNN